MILWIVWIFLPLTAISCKGSPSSPLPSTYPQIPTLSRPPQGTVVAGVLSDPKGIPRGSAMEAYVGDFVLMNHDAVFFIHNENPSEVYITNGGGLIDADLFRGVEVFDEESRDLIQDYAPAIDVMKVFDAEKIEIVVRDPGESPRGVTAVGIRVTGYLRPFEFLAEVLRTEFRNPIPDLSITTEYFLEPDQTTIEIVTTLKNLSPEEKTFHLGDAFIPSDHFGDPFAERVGFDRKRLEGDVRFVGAVGEDNGLAILFTNERGKIGILGPGGLIIQGDFAPLLYAHGTCTVKPHQTCSYRRFFTVAPSPHRALQSLYNYRKIRSEPIISGRVVYPNGSPVEGARVFLTKSSPSTWVVDLDITQKDGGFFLFPEGKGEYLVWVRGTERGERVYHPEVPPLGPVAEGILPLPPIPVTVERSLDLGSLTVSEPAYLSLQLKNEQGVPLPGKVTLVREEGATPPHLPFGETRAYGGRKVEKIFWEGNGSTIEGKVIPGTYTLYGSYGLEYGIHRISSLPLRSGERYALALTLPREVNTDGWAQCDTHVHTAFSNHGRTTHTDRILTVLAEGLNCIAITDHDRIMDLTPYAKKLGVEKHLLLIVSEEVSTFRYGHFNPYPLLPDPFQPNNGAVPWWIPGFSVVRLFETFRAKGAKVIQVNHGADGEGYFSFTGYDPKTGKGGPEYIESYDVLELVNGKEPYNWKGEREVAISLWNRGLRKGIVGVSDSHHRIPEAGYGRTYLPVGVTDPGNFNLDQVMAKFLQMEGFVGGGPFIQFTVDGERPGGTVTAETATVTIDLYAPTWMEMKEVRLLYNGEIRKLYPLPPTSPNPLRLSITETIPIEKDGWLAVEAIGEGDLFPVYPGAIPYGMTNPIFVRRK